MGEIISDKELRRRLSAFNTVVPPVTNSTRKLLLKKLENFETSQSTQFDSSSKASETSSLMNVSNWNLSASEDEDYNSYLLPGMFFMLSILFYLMCKCQLFIIKQTIYLNFMKLFYRKFN